TAVSHRPAGAATTSKVKMNTYFMRAGLSSRLHRFGAGRPQEVAHGAAALWGAVDGHAEAIVSEPRIERRARTETRQPTQHDHADHGRETAEEHHHLERDDEEGRQRRAGDPAGPELHVLAAGDEAPHQRAPDR